MYILLSKCYLEEGKKYNIDDNPWMFQQVIVIVNDNITKYINYKYEWCQHTTTKFCDKNISCWFISSLIFFIFFCLKWFKIWFVFYPTNLMNLIFKKFDQKCFKFCCVPYQIWIWFKTNLIKLLWLCISEYLSIIDWFK